MERKVNDSSMFGSGDGPPGCSEAVPRDDHKRPSDNVIGIDEVRCLLSVRRMARLQGTTPDNPNPDPNPAA